MRILFQYFSGGGGGLSNVILLLKTYVREFPDDELIVVCSEGSELAQLASFPNVRVVTIPSGRVKEWTRFRLGLIGLRKLVRQHEVDVVWSLNLGSYVRLPVPSLLALNNAHQVYPWAITRFHPGSPLRVALLRFFFRRSLKSADAVLVQTPLMADYSRKIAGAPSNIFVVPKAVERSGDVVAEALPASLADRLSSARKEGSRLWLYVATAMPHKNHKVVLDAFSELANRGSRDSLILTLSREEAESFGGEGVASLIANGRLVLAGWVKKEHLRALYDSCDACVMPSLLESLSSSHLEAMEWSKPQIVADLPYARDLCGDSAVYVPADSSTAWADAIERVSHDLSLQRELVESGKARIRDFPEAWSECAHRVRGCLTSLVGI